MRRPRPENTEIHQCMFEVHILEAEALIKFPCRLFVSWKTSSNKEIARTINNNITVDKGVGLFNEIMAFNTYLLFDKEKNTYNRKETTLSLLLVSFRMPDEEKVVGRVSVDLADVINNKAFEEPKKHPLEFCSVKNSTLKFAVVSLKTQKTDLKPFQLDLEEFSHISGSSKVMNMSSNSNEFNFKTQGKEASEHNYSESPSHPMKNEQSVPNLRNKEFIQTTSPKKIQIDAENKIKILELEAGKKQLEERLAKLDQIEVERNTLVEENLRLFKLLEEKKSLLIQETQKKEQAEQKNLKLEMDYSSLDREKKATEEELLKLIRQETEQKFTAQKNYREVKQQLDSRKQQEGRPEIIPIYNSEQLQNLRQQLQKLTANLQESENIRLEFEEQNLDLKYQLSQVKGEMELYERSIEQKNQEIKQLMNQLEAVRKDLVEQPAREPEIMKSMSDIERNEYSKEIDSLKAMVKLLTEELVFTEHAKNKLKEMDFDYSLLCQEKESLQRENSRLISQKSIIESRISNKSIEKESPNNQHEIMEKKIDDLQIQLHRLKDNLVSSENDYSELLELNKDLEMKIIRLEQQNEKIKTERNAATEKYNQILHQKQKFIQQRKQWEEEFTTLKKQLQILQEEKTSINNELSKKQLSEETLKKYIYQKDEFLESLSKDLKMLHDEKNNIELHVKKVEYENRKLQAQMKSNNMNIKQEEKELKKLESANYKLEAEIKILKEKLEKVERELKTKQGSLLQKEIINENLNKNLQEQVGRTMEMEEKISKFGQKEAKMRENIMILEEESKKIYEIVVEKEQNEELQNQIIEEKEEEINNLRSVLGQTKSKLSAADEEVKSLKRQVYDLKRDSIIKPSEHEGSYNNDEDYANNEESDRFQQIFDLNNQRIEQLEDEIRRKDDQLLQISVNYQQKIHNLENEKKQLERGRIFTLENERNQLKSQKKEIQEKLKRAQLIIEDKNIRLKELEKNKQLPKNQQQKLGDSRKEQNQFLRQRIQTLEKEVTQNDAKVTEYKNLITQYQLKIQQMQAQKHTAKNSYQQITSENSKVEENSRINQIQRQNELLRKNNQSLENSLSRLQMQLNSTQRSLKNIQDDKEVEKMSVQLDKQFKIVEEKKKSAAGDSMRKSFSIDNQAQNHEVVEACRVLKEILNKRLDKDSSESIIELLVNKNVMMEQGLEKINLQRGIIQQNARKLSMQFQKIKAKVLKGKGSFQDKNQLLSSLKPCETQVKDLVSLSENLLDLQLEVELDQCQ